MEYTRTNTAVIRRISFSSDPPPPTPSGVDLKLTLLRTNGVEAWLTFGGFGKRSEKVM
jgi:hypothetical protein